MEPSILLAATTDVSAGPPPWITTAVYLWLSMLCAWSWWGGRRTASRGGSLAWLALTVLFSVLGVAKPFGAQWLLADVFRQRAIEGDWYDVRRRFQAGVVLTVVALAATATLATVAFAVRRRSWHQLAGLAPIAALLGFLAVRVTSLHQVDAILYHRLGPFDVNMLVEWTILALVAAGLVWRASAAHQRVANAADLPDEATGPRRYTVR